MKILLRLIVGMSTVVALLVGPAAADLSTGLVAYYPFDGNAQDATAFANDGQVLGATLDSDRNGESNSSYSFGGDGDIILVQSDSQINFGTGDFTISFWMKAPFGADYAVMGKASGGIPHSIGGAVSGPSWNIQVENTLIHGWGARLDLWDGANGGFDILSNRDAVDGNWHHVVFTVDKDVQAEMYVDGVLVDVADVSGIGTLSNNEPLRIGQRKDWSSTYIGNLDDLRLYNRHLSESEIQQLYTGIQDDEGPITSNVVADPNPVAAATSLVDITANVDDTNTGGSNIASASYTLNGGGETVMAAADGIFDEPAEDVTATLADMLLAGVYDICVSGTDAVGNTGTEECTFLVVYDPDAGFVTGGGWIDSPLGAYVDDPGLTGKANFGFVAKYKKGQSVPDGNTEFQFKAGDLNFKSIDYEWLVVAGAKGMFKGWGTINGTGNYGFMVSAVDAALTPSTDADLFRIKVWDKDNSDALVYDNEIGADDDEDPTTEIGGGSIIIHKK